MDGLLVGEGLVTLLVGDIGTGLLVGLLAGEGVALGVVSSSNVSKVGASVISLVVSGNLDGLVTLCVRAGRCALFFVIATFFIGASTINSGSLSGLSVRITTHYYCMIMIMWAPLGDITVLLFSFLLTFWFCLTLNDTGLGFCYSECLSCEYKAVTMTTAHLRSISNIRMFQRNLQ